VIVRSYLFVPGNRPERFAKALAAGAHAVIVDLEDAVPPAQKEAARDAVAHWLSAAQPVIVRINAAGTPWFNDDLKMCARPGVAAIVVPKAETAETIAAVRSHVGEGVGVLPLIESARALWNALAVGRAPGVERLVFGSIDYQADLGIGDDELLHARSQIVLASRVAEIAAPVDGVTTAIEDADALRRETLRARSLGFGAKLCVHPKQVAIVNEAFQPSAGEIEWARRVVAADAAANGAAVAVDGRMVDRPVLLKARAILDEASAC
jgi:citrate lyase subunit beta/citryl-CoA lyase